MIANLASFLGDVDDEGVLVLAPAASLSRQRDLANDLDMDCIRITEISLPPADKDRVVARQFSPSSRRVDVTQLPWVKFECDVACFSRSKMNR